MDSMPYNFTMEDQKPIFTSTGETLTTTSTDTFVPSDNKKSGGNRDIKWEGNASENVFSPLAGQFQGRGGNDLLNMFAQQEPRAGDTAPHHADIDMMNFRMNNTDALFDDVDQSNSAHNFYMGGSRTESVASTHGNLWGESTGVPASGNNEMIDTFDFLVKSLASANNYVSMLTREQLSVLRSIRPSLLYEFLQEVARVRGDKRMRRALPNECAFCKNNGENEECYSSHALKDWRGRVECPVLRAFRCPRCGATGDHAHTIKYCSATGDRGSDRTAHGSRRGLMMMGNNLNLNMSRMRGGQPPSSSAPSTPSPSPATASLTNSAIWSSFGIN